MTNSIAAAPARPVGRRLAAITGTAILSVSLALAMIATAPAQTPAPAPAAPAKPAPAKKPPAKPAAAAPAAPAAPPAEAQQPPPAQGQQQAQGNDQVQLIYSPWTKFCLKGQEANAKQVCFTGKDARIESGMPVVAAVLIEPEGEPKKVLRVTLPLGMQLIHGTRVILSQDGTVGAGSTAAAINWSGASANQASITFTSGANAGTGTLISSVVAGKSLALAPPLKSAPAAGDGFAVSYQPLTAPYVICFTNGCMADYEATADMIVKMKSAGGLVVQAINATGQAISLVLPMADFAKAYDGPPTDPKVFEDQQKKLQDELQRRADEARKKLEQQQGGQPQAQAPKQ
jgi:invasion protein IalB